MTRDELAEFLGDVTASTINKWERGIHAVPQWVEERMFASVKLALPLDDLQALLGLATDRGISFSRLLSEAIREHLERHSGKIIRIPSRTEEGDPSGARVAEDPSPSRVP